MKNIVLVFVVWMGLSQAQAKTILVSDIDDTIKNSHVLDKSDAINSVDKIENTVLGMSELYNAAQETDQDLKIYYVTNAPASLLGYFHRSFLSFNNFPHGEVRLRENIFQSDFKLKEIRKILHLEKPNIAILIGDNGEKDAAIYEQIVHEFPQIHFVTYIRQAYSTLNRENRGAELRNGQTGFATSLDLAVHFRENGFVTQVLTLDFVRDFISAYDSENEMRKHGPHAIPSWMDCRNFQWSSNDLDLVTDVDYLNTKSRIIERCLIKAHED